MTYRLFLTLLIVCGFINPLSAVERKCGLIRPSAQEVEHITKHSNKIVGIKPNKLGAIRIQKHLKKRGKAINVTPEAVSPEDEFVIIKGVPAETKALTLQHATTAIPRSVDNSHLPSFPGIGDQKSLGACVAWATTYYQATHELGLLNGHNNKKSKATVLSPKWTYNLLNEGQDEGLNILTAFDLISQSGAINYTQFPYDTNFRAWDLRAADWVTALSNRTTSARMVNIDLSHSANLSLIKQILNNGHVLVLGTYIYSWVMTTVQQDPSSSAANQYVGQMAASWVNGTEGAHCMTIVGYNDDIWIDINENGKVDQGEKGAFLVANQWSTDWGNAGFIWISYDAFKATSGVQNGPTDNREAAASILNSYVVSVTAKSHNYHPKLYAQLKLNQTKRNQINVYPGISNTKSTSPSKALSLIALNFSGGNYGFDGKTNKKAQSFVCALDFTDLLPANQSTQRYYIALTEKEKNSSPITSFTLYNSQNKKVPTSSKLKKGKNGQFTAYIDYAAPKSSTKAESLTVTITHPIDGAILKGDNEIIMAVKGTEINFVDLFVDNTFLARDETAPYIISWDTKMSTNGKHILKAIVYDKTGNKTQHSLNITVANP